MLSLARVKCYTFAVLAVGALAAIFALLVSTRDAVADPVDPSTAEFFEKDIRPLLAEKCQSCHGNKKTRGGLRLTERQRLLEGGDSGPAVVPGKPDESLLIRAVERRGGLKMPPTGQLSAAEIARLRRWVNLGVPWPDVPASSSNSISGTSEEQRRWWAFQSVRAVSLPPVRDRSWACSEIDRFILASLEATGLPPAKPADRQTLIRRATFDLTGLPAAPEEVDAFLADASADAFRKVVDRLLASPRYGERWGRHWLDLVRYTDDFELGWRYRDWVVKAVNEDLPYDQFLANQIAGDRLPAPDAGAVNVDGIVATTMLAIGQWGGIDRKKRMADIVDDQIDTVGRTFLGLTIACARCHDHKFDPVPTSDYYGLAGIFYSSRVISDAGYLSHLSQRLEVPLVPPAAVERHRKHAARVRELEVQLAREVDRHYTAFARSLLPHSSKYVQAAWDYQHQPIDLKTDSIEEFASRRKLHAFALRQWLQYLGGSPLGTYRLLHNAVKDYDGEAGVRAWMGAAERPWWGVNTNRHEVAIETFVLPPRTVSMYPSVDGGAVAWTSPISGRVRVAGRLVDADPQDGVGVAWAVDLVSGSARHELSSGTMPREGTISLDQGRYPERLASIEVSAGDMIYLQMWLSAGDAHYDVSNVELTITRLDGPGEWDLTRDVVDSLLEGNPHRDTQGHRNVWSFYDMAGSRRKHRIPALDGALEALAPLAGEQKARALQAMIDLAGSDGPLVRDLVGPRSPFWVSQRDDAKYLSAAARASLSKRMSEVESLKRQTPPLPCAHGAQEGGPRFSMFPGIQDARIHRRGNHEQLGEIVPRHFPRVLAGDKQPSIASGSGRLELARWIGAADNPLTARVMVNRIWQHHFGQGIVATPSNFGRMGAPPSHPQLLDWLARRFVESGWSVKAMHRLIMLSSAYQQSSKAAPETLRADPTNQLVGRMSRRRLEAEALRDSLLYVCNQLDERRGGPADGDPQSRRRLLYLRSTRSDRSGFGSLFDGPDASIHVENRTNSTVAPQALFLMNDSLVLGAVQHLTSGRQFLHGNPADRVQRLYGLVFGRNATAEEVILGCQAVESLAAEAAAGQPSGAAPLGAWEAYAQALLLSNEFLFMD